MSFSLTKLSQLDENSKGPERKGNFRPGLGGRPRPQPRPQQKSAADPLSSEQPSAVPEATLGSHQTTGVEAAASSAAVYVAQNEDAPSSAPQQTDVFLHESAHEPSSAAVVSEPSELEKQSLSQAAPASHDVIASTTKTSHLREEPQSQSIPKTHSAEALTRPENDAPTKRRTFAPRGHSSAAKAPAGGFNSAVYFFSTWALDICMTCRVSGNYVYDRWFDSHREIFGSSSEDK